MTNQSAMPICAPSAGYLDSCAQINRSNSLADYARGLGQLGQAGLAQAQQYRTLRPREPMTAADLGIVDQSLDDKIGMEP